MSKLIVIVLLGFLFFRMLGFLIKMLSGTQTSSSRTQQRNYSGTRDFNGQQQRTNGEIHIDYVPGKNSKSSDRFEGGEYVDYEEIK